MTIPFALRPYQIALDEGMTEAFCQGAQGVCAVLPTGGGKTSVFATRLGRFVAAGERVGVLVHRTELIDQTIGALRRAGVRSIGAIAAKLPHLRDEGARVQVCSLQTLYARGLTREPFDRLLFDEFHHFADESSWGEFGARYAHVPREGYTATPQRSDGKGLRGLADALVVGPTFAELCDLGFLVRPRIFSPWLHLKSKLAQDPVAYWLEKGCAGKRTLWFAKSKTHGAELEHAFAAAGYPALLIHEGTSRAATQRAFSDYLASPTRLPVLTNVFRLTEGTDLPPTEVIGLARSCDEDITYVQAVGRGARPAPGKTHYVVLDLVGATRKHGPPTVSRTYSLDGKGSVTAEFTAWQCEFCGGYDENHAPGAPCPHCGEVPAKQERASSPTPNVTGDAMFEVVDGGAAPPARRRKGAPAPVEPLSPAELAAQQARDEQAAADLRDARFARLARNQIAPTDLRTFGQGLQDRLALWHARQERRHVR